ncbi:hypothetical protein H9L13_04150 [Sphingomonas lutea]|uniref:Pentapeptide MXKDX repeat protein n=1 Tax=Sphingomonas lutea TaxID=1045317 RepID=A0A7G9SJR6_9SPHN|nr:hypothetical protein [Sphingomonas lutea]QNN68091.1 hypothetical protein H9L13_04150 [Sphingomonas lutea]
MRALFLAAGAVLTLSACSPGDDAVNNEQNDNMMADNMMVDQNAAMTGGMDANMATNATTENMMMNDMMTNEADTNLANGM